ncbi:MAG: hypothetical protein EOL98_15265 [Negativicutes bacterium]|nr:hypothetical protein [Negativicutes bacterium]
MKPEEALKNIGDWISEETEQRKYDKATVIELADSLITLKDAVNKQALIERAISAFIGQAGENDGYLGCYMVHRQNHQHCQTGDTVRSLDELVEWYKENFPEEVQP